MKSKLIISLVFCCVFASCMKENNTSNASMGASSVRAASEWNLIFEEEFSGTSKDFDASKWEYAARSTPAWALYLTSTSDYVHVADDNLVLRMDNKSIQGDDVPYHSGGVQTLNKFSFTYGKVEVRAKFKQGQGSWPAIWMMPVSATYGGWPNSGEIDIMEHVNNESSVHQTIHNGAVTSSAGSSSFSKSTPYNISDYNIYGIEWYEDRIDFFVNGTKTTTYSKPANATSAQWPFDKPFYIILNQSGGAGWPGPIVDSDLPFQMDIDWVRVYQQ